MIAPVLKFPGAKWNLAAWITAHMPAHRAYVEPFFGSGAVFFRKRPAKVEVINDLDGRVVNLFRVIRERPEELVRAVEMTPWSREEYRLSYELSDEPVEDARRLLVRSWQAHAHKCGEGSGWRRDLSGRRGASCVSDWRVLPARLLASVERLKDAHIENRPAPDVIADFASSPDALIYCDPPYLIPAAARYYRHAMTLADHEEMLHALRAHSSMVMLSGYDHALYDELLSDWRRLSTASRAEKGRRREEVLWLNPAAAEALDGRLF